MIIDIVVGAIILISAVISFLRGFIRETLTIAGVAGGVFAAIAFGSKLSPTFRNWLGVVEDSNDKLFDIIPMSIVADVCAYAVIFIFVVIIISIISHFVSTAVKAMGLGPIDRTLGVIFGIIRAVLLLALLYLPFHLLMEESSKAEYFADSKTHIYIEKTSNFIAKFLPSSQEVKDKVEETADGEIKKRLFENNLLINKNAKPIVIEDTPESGYERDERQELNDLIDEQPDTTSPTVTPNNQPTGNRQPIYNN